MSASRAVAAAAAFALAAAGILLAQGALVAAAVPIAAWAIASARAEAQAAARLGLEAERRLSSTFLEPGALPPPGEDRGAGEGRATVDVEVEVRNRGGRIELLTLVDIVPPGAVVASGRTEWRGSLDSGASAFIRYTVGVGRGVHSFEAVQARAEDPFLAAAAEAELPCPLAVVAPPPIQVAPDCALSAPQARPFSGLSRSLRQGGGTDFAGTRQYSPGDPLRSLNWRAEALWGQAIVNVHEEERALDAGVILDCRAQAYDRQALFESAVSAAASLAEALLDGGHRVAFLSYGSVIEWTPPGSGKGQRTRIREAAAKAALGSHAAFERFDNIPVKLFPPRSLVLLVSPLARGDLVPLRTLIALGYAVCVLKPDLLSGRGEGEATDEAAALALEISRAEDAVLSARLVRAGATIIAWDVARPLSAARLVGARRRGAGGSR